MLKLLLKYRFIYYRNFIYRHFTRRVKIELGLIMLLLFYMLVRSPADMGYNLRFLGTTDFNTRWPLFWLNMLPLLYAIFEVSAYVTLRPGADWNISGALPIPGSTIINYYLLRYFFKTGLWLIAGTFLFLGGTLGIGWRLLNMSIALVWLLIITLIAFLQAFHLRNREATGWLIWFFIEITVFSGLFLVSDWGLLVFQGFSLSSVGVLLSGMIFLPLIFIMLRQRYHPAITPVQKRQSRIFHKLFDVYGKHVSFMQKPIGALILNDLLFLVRRKRILFFSLILETAILSAAIISQEKLMGALVSSVFIQLLFGWLFVINILLVLFERDADFMIVIRMLPVSAVKIWGARWLLIAGLVAFPVLIPYLIIFYKFELVYQFWVFLSVVIWLVPGILATLYCNTGFALFPQAQLTAYILNISILLMVLFWFYMPFGTLIFLGVSLVWIRKAQQHYQRIELL